jgi:Yip1 domain
MAHSQDQIQASSEQNPASDQPILSTRGDSSPSLSRTLPQLPHQYTAALIKPSVATFTEGIGNASWSLVWVQLLAWAALDAILGVLVNLLYPPATSSFALQLFSLASSFGLIIVVPLLFFLLMGIVYLLARSFGGQGTFLQQCHSSLQIQVPLGIMSKILALIPVVGRILNSILSLYGIVLQVVVIMAVHRLTRGKAIAVLLIPIVGIAVLTGVAFLLIHK